MTDDQIRLALDGEIPVEDLSEADQETVRAVQQLARERHQELLQEYRASKYTYRVAWANEVRQWRATCDQLQGLNHLATTPEGAIRGVISLVGEIVKNNQESWWTEEPQSGEGEVGQGTDSPWRLLRDDLVPKFLTELRDQVQLGHHAGVYAVIERWRAAAEARRGQLPTRAEILENAEDMAARFERGEFKPVPGSAMISVTYLQENPDALVRLLREIAPDRLAPDVTPRLVDEDGNVTAQEVPAQQAVSRPSMTLIDRIVVDPSVVHGRPAVRGTRTRVSDVLALLAAGADTEEILTDYPYLVADDIKACLQYAAFLANEKGVTQVSAGDVTAQDGSSARGAHSDR